MFRNFSWLSVCGFFEAISQRALSSRHLLSSAARRVPLLSLVICFVAFSVAAEPIITQSRYQVRVRVDDDALTKAYDSNDEARVVTTVDKRLSTFRPSVSEGSGGCPITDTAESTAEIAGDVTPTQITVSGRVAKIWTTSHHELCDYASVSFDAESSLLVQLDAGADAVAGKEYSVNVSGSLSSNEVRGWLEGLTFSGGRASFPGGTFSFTYALDMSGATPGQLEFLVTASGDAGETGWGTTVGASAVERNTTYVGEDDFRLRVVLFDRNDARPPENCDNGFDDDFDGDIDSVDTDCPSPEVCDNGLDDDLDGDVDAADIDCALPGERVGLEVRCMHEPVYPQNGEQVTIRAEAYTEASLGVVADEIQIFKDDMTVPAAATTAAESVNLIFIANDDTFSYGCRAYRNAVPYSETATSWRANDPKLRTVDTGTREDAYPPWVNGVPVMLNGAPKDKIDVIFFADDSEYPLGASDPAFRKDVYELIYFGYFRIPWFIHFQHYFNFWIGFDGGADAGLAPAPNPKGLCTRQTPTGFKSRYSWVDTAAIVHQSACRDNAGKPGSFTIEVSANTLRQVVAHETGHRPFGLGDEYCCDGGYLTSSSGLLSSKWNPPYPNIFKKKKHCEDDAEGRSYQSQDCRLMNVGADLDKERWFLEPFHRNSFRSGWRLDQTFDPNALIYRDLMQQTGQLCNWLETADSEGNPTGTFQWFCRTQYKVGNSERNRMSWYLDKCIRGEC